MGKLSAENYYGQIYSNLDTKLPGKIRMIFIPWSMQRLEVDRNTVCKSNMEIFI